MIAMDALVPQGFHKDVETEHDNLLEARAPPVMSPEVLDIFLDNTEEGKELRSQLAIGLISWDLPRHVVQNLVDLQQMRAWSAYQDSLKKDHAVARALGKLSYAQKEKEKLQFWQLLAKHRVNKQLRAAGSRSAEVLEKHAVSHQELDIELRYLREFQAAMERYDAWQDAVKRYPESPIDPKKWKAPARPSAPPREVYDITDWPTFSTAPRLHDRPFASGDSSASTSSSSH